LKPNEEMAKENPRFLHLWFSHPGIDGRSFLGVTLLDAEGNPLPRSAVNYLDGKICSPRAGTGDLGWITHTLSPGRFHETPETVTVRLKYGAGPWKSGGDVGTDFRGVMHLADRSTLSGIGQNADGKAFISITEDWSRAPATQFGFTATTKDGRELDNPSVMRGGPASGPAGMEQFEFDVPLDQIKRFHFRTRPIKTVEFKNVSLQAGKKTEVEVSVVKRDP
jgi:hypothetical protein